MDNLFRLVFSNKVIRNQIFKFIRIINKDIVVKRYNQCNINWIINNHHYHLLLYKFQKDIKKRNQFTDELFYRFLESNSELDILLEIFKIFPQFLPSTPLTENKLIEHCSRLKPTSNTTNTTPSSASSSSSSSSLEIIKYITNALNIKVTNKSIDNACSVNNCIVVKYFLGFNDNEEDRYKGNEININEHCNISTLFCSMRGKDFQLFQLVLDNNPSLIKQYSAHDKLIKLLVKTGDVQFITHYCNLQADGFQFPQLKPCILEKSSLEIIKYLSTFLKTDDPLFYKTLLFGFEKRKNKTERLEFLKFFFEDFKIHQKFEGSAVPDLIFSSSVIGDLECIIYLHDFYSSLPPQYNNRFFIPHTAVDISISSGNLHVTNWFLENSNVCCSIYGLKYLCKNISKLKDILDRILNKFTPNGIISNEMILQAMHSTNRICHEKENFDYLAYFLPNHLIPIFPMETSIEDYDY
ncbi:hypothetical protein ACTFIU_003523 [Dictyostelium citrinum]